MQKKKRVTSRSATITSGDSSQSFTSSAVRECASSPRGAPAGRKQSVFGYSDPADDYEVKDEYDLSTGVKFGPVLSTQGKTRITIMFDNDVIDHFRARSSREGRGYQTMINAALRESIRQAGDASDDDRPATIGDIRKLLREALKR
jgi:uncharacterized protein (DUF4415 family)